jgi:hypothetical protein
MQTAEFYRVLLFVSLVGAVYVLAAAIGLRWLLYKLGRWPLSLSPGQIRSQRIVLGLALIGLLCIAYGYFIEPYWPSITHVQIKTSKLAPGSRPVRIVHISDLHSDPQPRLEGRLPSLIAEQKPDIIVFAGDTINSPAALPIFKQCLAELAAIAPTFAVKGNWDARAWRRLDLFGGTGVRELDGEAVTVNVGGSSVWVAGVAVEHEERLEQAISAVPSGALIVFLYHSPDLILEVSQQNVDLYCAGHTHGGQVALPFYGALITLSKFGKQYEAGLYRVSQTWLYVNRGIGMEGGGAPRVRFCARPEITLIEVIPES